MKIAKIGMSRFTAHDATSVAVPTSGIVAVVGSNGSGKSSFIEAVSYALWGKTLRGAVPWRSDTDGLVSVEGFGVSSQRKRDGGKVRLSWATAHASSAGYDTNTKAQEALEAVIGSWDVWRRTHVFSSQDAAHFSTATDGERKRLLESLLGLDRFDAALDRCRAAGKTVNERRFKADRALAAARATLEAAEVALTRSKADLAAAPPAGDPAALAAEADRIQALAHRAGQEARSARAAEQTALSGAVEKGGDLRGMTQRLGALSGRSACPTCQQSVPAALVADLAAAIKAEHARAQEAERAARASAATYRADAEELDAEADTLRTQATTLRVAAKAAVLAADASRRVQAAHARALKERDAARGSVALEVAEVAAADARLATLDAVGTVLGLRGVRAHVLAQSLSGLEDASAAWLSRLSGDLMRVQFSPYSEKKAGGVSDAISIRCGTSRHEMREYDSLSGGERRRVDVSVLLALSEIAAAAHGTVPGTLFFDEVFDALDPAGVDAVADVLGDLATDRAIIVITHSPDLAARLPAAVRWAVDGGRLKVL
jgi:DNA repair exonuclease SbcCD ATPase subunit